MSALLQIAHPVSVSNDTITIGVEFDFSLQQMEKPNVKNYLTKVLSDALGLTVKVDINIDQNYSENHQTFKGKNDKEVGDILDTFGGEVV